MDNVGRRALGRHVVLLMLHIIWKRFEKKDESTSTCMMMRNGALFNLSVLLPTLKTQNSVNSSHSLPTLFSAHLPDSSFMYTNILPSSLFFSLLLSNFQNILSNNDDNFATLSDSLLSRWRIGIPEVSHKRQSESPVITGFCWFWRRT